MKKRILSALVCIGLSIGMLPTTSLAMQSENAAAPEDYLKLGDYVVISPAQSRNGTGLSTTWAINVQDGGHINGQDIQMWEMGTSVKFCVRRYDQSKKAFALIPTNYRESEDENSGGKKFWDLEGRKTSSGTNIHVWEDDDLNDDNKLFYVEPNGDGDPETFYLCSYYARDKSTRYLAPESSNWEQNGCNIRLTSTPFSWRVQVLNRDAGNCKASWMNQISDNTLLSNINIPGTHDSGTANVEGSWNENFNVVATQKYFIDEQLFAGIRSLDIRYAYNESAKEIVLCHGSGSYVCHDKDHGKNKDTNLTLKKVMDAAKSFLNEHPSETIIMTLKQDDGNSKAPSEMAKVILEYTDICYDWSNSSPTLGDVRSKIVLMTRTPAASLNAGDKRKYFGPDISNWDNLYNDDIHFAQQIYSDSSSKGNVWIQDDYECSDGNKKMQVLHVLDQLNKSAGSQTSDNRGTTPNQPSTSDFVFNYTSKTTSDSAGLSPLGGARIMNHYLLYDSNMKNYFAGSTKYRSGITVMDYIDKSMAQYIINSNFTGGSLHAAFTDVSESDWFHEAVYSSVQNGYFTGVGNNQFAPNVELTRASLAQVLYNAAGKPALDDTVKNPFADVSAGQWYTDAVIWASNEGIVSGYGNNQFGPDDSLTREQAVQILYNYAVYNNYSTDGTADLRTFADASSVSDWSNTAMQWSVANHIIAGTDTGLILPQGTATRAQMAQIIMHFHQLYHA